MVFLNTTEHFFHIRLGKVDKYWTGREDNYRDFYTVQAVLEGHAQSNHQEHDWPLLNVYNSS